MPLASELPSADGGGTRRPRRVDLPKDRALGERHRATSRSGQIAPTRQAHARRQIRVTREGSRLVDGRMPDGIDPAELIRAFKDGYGRWCRIPRYAIVEAPSALGHVPEHLGVERGPADSA